VLFNSEMKVDGYYQWYKCSRGLVISGNMKFMQIFVEVP